MFCIKSHHKLENLDPNSENVNEISTLYGHVLGWSPLEQINKLRNEYAYLTVIASSFTWCLSLFPLPLLFDPGQETQATERLGEIQF